MTLSDAKKTGFMAGKQFGDAFLSLSWEVKQLVFGFTAPDPLTKSGLQNTAPKFKYEENLSLLIKLFVCYSNWYDY